MVENCICIVYLSLGGKVKTAGSIAGNRMMRKAASVDNQMNLVGSQMTRNTASVEKQMNLALSVAENVMGGRSPNLRSVLCYLIHSSYLSIIW